jgi:hypothetical protein
MSSRRQARRQKVAPVFKASEDPHRVTQETFESLRGVFRGWFRGGVCRRVRAPDGRMYGWEEAPDVWASLLDGSYRPIDFK